jgi:16S rRNA (guanine527-N7)-methyltransferase
MTVVAQADPAVQLSAGLAELKLDLPEPRRRQLLAYQALLQKWNKVHNLTAIRDPEKMVTGHLLDSLSVVPHIPAGDLLDVGSGGGLPGIPLAICAPQRRLTLLDSNQKKTAFLRQVAAELALTNVTVVTTRAEDWQPARTFDVITARALSELAELVSWSGHLLSENGSYAAMKGVYPRDEISRLPAAFRVRSVIPLHVPGLNAERHLVMMERAQ